MKIRENDLKLIMEQIVDFKSFEVNVYPLKEHFEFQRWLHLFDILNGPTYPYLVKDLWVRVEVYDEVATSFEEKWNIVEDEANRRKSISEIGLKQFKEVKIRSVVMGVGVTITQRDIAKLSCVANE
ncbi:uncharacterized protein LOC127081894 [Lathyrus oleraceus]|uniref:uncharacterized protein LOC127081894 n=1 Tax=Pisum sativum TaxID=3888 RepID=UPI0021D2C2DA|nr:uncharacterized protein LOC127081894 [Pisum sativum]